jgi:integrase/recombinase XerD
MNDKIIERFVEYLRVEKGLSPLTIAAYRNDLAQLSQFLGGRQLITARRQDLSDYLRQLLSSVEARSAGRKVATLRHFFKFLLMDRLIVADPMLRIESPKGWKRLPEWLSPSEIDIVLTAARGDNAKALRDQAILELAYGAGLRASEIVGARLSNLNLSERYILVHGKRDKERIAPFGHRAAEALKQYLERRPRESPWLFPGRKGKHLTRQRFWQIVNQHFQQIGRSVHPHMLRHSLRDAHARQWRGFADGPNDPRSQRNRHNPDLRSHDSQGDHKHLHGSPSQGDREVSADAPRIESTSAHSVGNSNRLNRAVSGADLFQTISVTLKDFVIDYKMAHELIPKQPLF